MFTNNFRMNNFFLNTIKQYDLIVQRSFNAFKLTRNFSAASEGTEGSDSIRVVNKTVDTLEWVLDSPPNIHQFDEPPIVVEIEHLDNLVVPEEL